MAWSDDSEPTCTVQVLDDLPPSATAMPLSATGMSSAIDAATIARIRRGIRRLSS
jgi:hypothetical protein